MLLLHKGDFNDRDEFGVFLNHRELTGVAVEVGTHRGEFADLLLQKWLGQELYCVDHWLADYNSQDQASNGDREQDYAQAVRVQGKHGPRMKIIHQSSRQAVVEFREE